MSPPPSTADAPPGPVPLFDAFLYWLKLGFVSFGGPAGQIAMMHTELVERRRWISEHRFIHALNYAMLLPGPEAQQLATYIGWLMHGTLGGIIAGVLFVLPSLGILIVLTWVYLAHGDLPVVAGILFGIKPAVTAIVVFAAWRIGSRVLHNRVALGHRRGGLRGDLRRGCPLPADRARRGRGGLSRGTIGAGELHRRRRPPGIGGGSWSGRDR